MPNPEMIAENVIYAVDKDGRGFDIGLQIGRPYLHADSPHEDWACPVALIGLYRRFPDMHGTDSLQALCHSLRLTRILLEGFVYDGGRLFWEPGGEPITVADVFGEVAEHPEPDGRLEPEQQGRVSRLTEAELASIDAAILRNCSDQFRKIARVVGGAMSENRDSIPNVPEVFYADRVRQLVAEGKLESQGNITAMRFGEVKLA